MHRRGSDDDVPARFIAGNRAINVR